jgi:hypothetical protein
MTRGAGDNENSFLWKKISLEVGDVTAAGEVFLIETRW